MENNIIPIWDCDAGNENSNNLGKKRNALMTTFLYNYMLIFNFKNHETLGLPKGNHRFGCYIKLQNSDSKVQQMPYRVLPHLLPSHELYHGLHPGLLP